VNGAWHSLSSVLCNAAGIAQEPALAIRRRIPRHTVSNTARSAAAERSLTALHGHQLACLRTVGHIAAQPTMLRPAVLQHGPSRCNTAHSTAPRAAALRVSDDSGTAGEASETRPETCGGPPLFEQRPAEEDARAEAAAVRVLVERGSERVREVRV
jgi:hypothetical protein